MSARLGGTRVRRIGLNTRGRTSEFSKTLFPVWVLLSGFGRGAKTDKFKMADWCEQTIPGTFNNIIYE